jgi:hypothetical protein
MLEHLKDYHVAFDKQDFPNGKNWAGLGPINRLSNVT